MIRLLGPLTFNQTQEIPANNTKLWLSVKLEYDNNSKELISKLIEDLQKIQKVINDSQHQEVHEAELIYSKEAIELEKWCKDCTGPVVQGIPNLSASNCVFINVCPKKNSAKSYLYNK